MLNLSIEKTHLISGGGGTLTDGKMEFISVSAMLTGALGGYYLERCFHAVSFTSSPLEQLLYCTSLVVVSAIPGGILGYMLLDTLEEYFD